MSVSITQSAGFSISGITPAAGTGFTLLANPALAATATYGDYFAETFTINALTPDTVQPMGDIATGSVIWIQTDSPITVTLTQAGPVDNAFLVDTFMFLNCTFTQIQLANASATTAANINLAVVGARVTNPGTPGIW